MHVECLGFGRRPAPRSRPSVDPPSCLKIGAPRTGASPAVSSSLNPPPTPDLSLAASAFPTPTIPPEGARRGCLRADKAGLFSPTPLHPPVWASQGRADHQPLSRPRACLPPMRDTKRAAAITPLTLCPRGTCLQSVWQEISESCIAITVSKQTVIHYRYIDLLLTFRRDNNDRSRNAFCRIQIAASAHT